MYDYHGTYICANISKIAPEVAILPVKFMSGTKGTIEDAIMSINYAIKRGATIINCSWNFNEYSEELYNVIKKNKDIIFVCAAGNSSINLDDEKLYPCSYKLDNIITVGAVDNKGNMYSSSGYGKAVDLVAPGVDIEVIVPDNDETTVSGTSISTSYVSATIALMVSTNPDLKPIQIKEILIKTASKISTLKGKCYANGCLNISGAVISSK